MADSCDELELGGVHNVGDDDPDTDLSLLSGDEVGMTCKSNVTVSVSKKTNKQKNYLGTQLIKVYQSHCRHLAKSLLNSPHTQQKLQC